MYRKKHTLQSGVKSIDLCKLYRMWRISGQDISVEDVK